MAAVIIPSGFGIATMVWTHTDAAKEYSCTMGFANETAETNGDVIATVIGGFWTATGAPANATNMIVGWTFERVSVLFRDEDEMLRSGSDDVGLAGTSVTSDQPQPAFSSLVVSKGTLFSGRSQRGRMYPPMTDAGEASVDINGRIDGVATLPTLRGQYAAMFGGWSTSEFPPYLLHAPDETPGPPTPPSLINSLTVKPIVGSQRRRKPRS